MIWNNFGCTEAQVLRKYAMAGYVPTADDFGGTAAVADAIVDAAEDIIQALPASILHLLQEPDLCILVQRCATDQVAAAFPAILKPVIPGSIHVWANPPQSFVSRPVLLTEPWPSNWPRLDVGRPYTNPTPPGAATELTEDAFAADADGIVLATPRSRNDMVLATWRVDVEDAAFSIPSLASQVANGAAAVLGAKVYPQASSQWDMVERLAEGFANGVAMLAKGQTVPPEVRSLQWWKEPEPDQAGGIGSVRRFRA